MPDNSEILRQVRRRDGDLKRQAALEAISALESSNAAITFPAVARRARVSVSLLYTDRELAGRIAAGRDRQRQAGRDRAWQLPARSLVTEASLRADLANARDHVRRLTEEVSILRERLARSLGADADIARGRALVPLIDELEKRAAELEAENHDQRQRLTQLEAEFRELAETLDAARVMNRELMGELNRRPEHGTTRQRLAGRRSQ